MSVNHLKSNNYRNFLFKAAQKAAFFVFFLKFLCFFICITPQTVYINNVDRVK